MQLTYEQRLGLTGLLIRQQPRKLKDQLTSFDLYKKVDLDEVSRNRCVKDLGNGQVVVNKSALAETTEVVLEKAEVRAAIDLLEAAEITVSDVAWVGPLVKALEAQLDAQ